MAGRRRSPDNLRPMQVYIGEKQVEALYEVSGRERRTISDIVRAALAEYLKDTDKTAANPV